MVGMGTGTGNRLVVGGWLRNKKEQRFATA
jgi:hypothetical protein